MQTHFERLKSIFKLKWRRVPHFPAIRKIIIGVCSDDIEFAFRVFSNEQSEAVPTCGLRQVCFDGKALNGNFSHVHDKRAFNIFQAFANYSQIILAHLCVGEKENEIPAFHEFLLSLNLKDCFVTADAMHFQKKL